MRLDRSNRKVSPNLRMGPPEWRSLAPVAKPAEDIVQVVITRAGAQRLKIATFSRQGCTGSEELDEREADDFIERKTGELVAI